jgi:hypothetical protein
LGGKIRGQYNQKRQEKNQEFLGAQHMKHIGIFVPLR